MSSTRAVDVSIQAVVPVSTVSGSAATAVPAMDTRMAKKETMVTTGLSFMNASFV
jgi:hypothetical protein